MPDQDLHPHLLQFAPRGSLQRRLPREAREALGAEQSHHLRAGCSAHRASPRPLRPGEGRHSQGFCSGAPVRPGGLPTWPNHGAEGSPSWSELALDAAGHGSRQEGRLETEEGKQDIRPDPR